MSLQTILDALNLQEQALIRELQDLNSQIDNATWHWDCLSLGVSPTAEMPSNPASALGFFGRFDQALRRRRQSLYEEIAAVNGMQCNVLKRL